MCKISSRAVLKANTKTIIQGRTRVIRESPINKNSIDFKVRVNGKTYSRNVTLAQIKESYSIAVSSNA